MTDEHSFPAHRDLATHPLFAERYAAARQALDSLQNAFRQLDDDESSLGDVTMAQLVEIVGSWPRTSAYADSCTTCDEAAFPHTVEATPKDDGTAWYLCHYACSNGHPIQEWTCGYASDIQKWF